MRHSRLSWQQQRGVDLIAVAHGSRDPRAAATVSELLSVVRARAAARPDLDGLDVRVAFLDHCGPSLPQVLGSLVDDGGADVDGTAIVVPLLLTAAYHSKTDIPAQLAAARDTAGGSARGLQLRCGDTLGPHRLLLVALERRLREAGVGVDSAAERAATSVVLAAAGSSDPAANATITDLAAAWRHDRGWHAVVPAYASAAAPSPAEAVRALRDSAARDGAARDGAARDGAARDGGAARVVVATYLLAPGYFADKIRASAFAAGASAVSAALGAAPEVADVILARYAAASRLNRLWAAPTYRKRTVATPQLVTSSNGETDAERILSYGACAAPRMTQRGRLVHS